jgi:hypothetical protein
MFLFFLFQKTIQLPSLFLGRTADFTLPFTGMKRGRLELKLIGFFFRRKIDVVVNGFCKSNPVVQQSRYLDQPFFGFCFHFIFIAQAKRILKLSHSYRFA